MKNKLLLLLAFVLVMIPIGAFADDSGTCGDNVTWTYEEATQTLTFSGSGAIPYNEYYYSNKAPWRDFVLSSVILSDGITSIGDGVFMNCRINSITIGKGLKNIGPESFVGCSLNSVCISDLAAWCSISFYRSQSNPLYYAKHLYLNGEEIKDLIIPDGVSSIENYAFDNFDALTSVTIPSSVTSIGAAFHGCANLTSVNIASGSIGGGAFYECTKLTSVELGDGVTYIGGGNNMYSFGAFQNCSSLTTVKIGAGMKRIGYCAFSGCTSLTSVYISDLAAWCSIEFGYGTPSDIVLHPRYYQNSLIENAQHLYFNGEEIKDLVIPDNVTRIGTSAFMGYAGLKSITIPSSVTSIGASAFWGCTGLNSISIPSSVTSIEEKAFGKCTGLNSVVILGSLTTIQNDAFQYCDGIACAEIHTEAIGSWFSGLSSLKQIVIGNEVTSIGDNAFSDCIGLTSIALPNSITTIGNKAFSGCTGLTTMTIPSSVTSIGEGLFRDCNDMKITLECQDINKWFNGLSSITEVTLTDNVQRVAESAFDNCTNLETITLGRNLSSIGYSAFANCSKLTVVKSYIEEPFWIDNSVFQLSLSGSTTLYVPLGTKSLYQSTSSWNQFPNIVEMEDNGSGTHEEKCSMPTIEYINGKLTFYCDTEGAVCHYEITDEDVKKGVGNEVELAAAYLISVYATKEAFDDSDKKTAMLYWVNVDPIATGLIEDELKVNTNAVLVQNTGGFITISGLTNDSNVMIYNISGQLIGQGRAKGNRAEISTTLSSDEICIIKIGDRSVKYILK